jgi:hypothetical protein
MHEHGSLPIRACGKEHGVYHMPVSKRMSETASAILCQTRPCDRKGSSEKPPYRNRNPLTPNSLSFSPASIHLETLSRLKLFQLNAVPVNVRKIVLRLREITRSFPFWKLRGIFRQSQNKSRRLENATPKNQALLKLKGLSTIDTAVT